MYKKNIKKYEKERRKNPKRIEYMINLRKKNNEKIKISRKIWEDKNRDKVKKYEEVRKEKDRNAISINCPCGGRYKPREKSKHLKTLRHKKYIDSI